MTRLQQARHLAITSEYWAAYLDGLVDRHRVCDTAPGTWDTPSAPIAEITAQHQQHPARRETWDSDWVPVPVQETPGTAQDGRTGGNGTGRPPAETNPAESAF